MSRIDITSSGTPLSDGMLQTANPLDATLQVVTDNVGNSSTVSLSTTETQINSVLRIRTNNSELLDIENTSGNRFNINRDVQKINLDFSSNPTGSTDIVGAIRTFIDGVNLSDVAQFQENGQVTLTERLKIESDSTVTTQTSSVIQSSTTNASLVIAPNGTGALVAAIPDGTSAGGSARGANAVDLQMVRSNANMVARGNKDVISGGEDNRTGNSDYQTIGGGLSNFINGQIGTIAGGYLNTINNFRAFIGGGQSNTVSSDYGVVSGGQSNTVSSGTHATVVGGQSNTASGNFSVVGGQSSGASGYASTSFGSSNNASGNRAFIAGGDANTASGSRSIVLAGDANQATSAYSVVSGIYAFGYLYGQRTIGNRFDALGNPSDSQISDLIACRLATLNTAATTVLSLDGTGVSSLIIPRGNNRAWNVQVNWVAVVTAITGTATGISVGDVVTSIDLLAFKKIGGVSSASAHTSAATKTMVTTPAAYAACAINYTAGASQEMAMTFTGPTFVGGGSVTMRVVARVELSEVAW
jgi:hypothetical protein